jgi:lysophospholipase L1-like esterase
VVARQRMNGLGGGELIPRVKYLLRFNQPPDFLVIHCGGNSIGAVKLRELRCQIKDSLGQLMALLPSTKLIWSQILPRIFWRYSQNSRALNRAAARINHYAAWICIQAGGGYIRYPELAWNEPMMFREDGVHLSDIGNELFLFRIQAYLFDFI